LHREYFCHEIYNVGYSEDIKSVKNKAIPEQVLAAEYLREALSHAFSTTKRTKRGAEKFSIYSLA
jgi:hypothetical protein